MHVCATQRVLHMHNIIMCNSRKHILTHTHLHISTSSLTNIRLLFCCLMCSRSLSVCLFANILLLTFIIQTEYMKATLTIITSSPFLAVRTLLRRLSVVPLPPFPLPLYRLQCLAASHMLSHSLIFVFSSSFSHRLAVMLV